MGHAGKHVTFERFLGPSPGRLGQVPVSYTHLDVYKRQGSFFAEVPGMQARGASATYQLKGRIAAGTLEADVGGTACGVHLSLHKL